ncbi:ABC transporter permease subunit [Cellulomonas sp. JH27-2]|uniref:ABC transporter permease subunit n=1 Tax=Cellulomonas sp. JH27-2 TaxID=2774139 RepID=UPI00177D84A9|nr:ABC transporter permease subunit [Cellulomonas sp. JH27-2]MBD8059896.1 ABC transporter permease subunit [Cellulomonas sp. JH27-2]
MNLLRVELARFYARVLLWCVAVGLFVVSGLVVFDAWHSSRPPSAAAVAEAQTFYEQQLKDFEENGEQMVADCKDQQSQDPDPKADYGCDQMKPKLEYYLPYTPSFAGEGVRSLGNISMAILLVAGLMGTSFVAAEFASGAISNWLTFAPRRVPVFASKLGAAFLGVLPAVILAVGVTAGGIVLAYSSHGLLDGVTDAAWAGFRDTSLRLLAVGPIAAVAGAALAFLLRHTAAVLGVVIGWAVVWEGLLRSLIPTLQPYTVVLDVTAWVQGGTTYSVEDCGVRAPDGSMTCEYVEHTLHMTQAGLQLGGLVVVLVVVALLVFRRRDVA